MSKAVRKNLIAVAIMFLILCGVSFIPAKGFLKFVLHFAVYILSGVTLFKDLYESLTKKKYFTRFLSVVAASILAFIAGEYAQGILLILLFKLSETFCDFAKAETKKVSDNAQNSDRKNIKRFVTRFSKFFTPTMISVAFLVIIIGIIASPSNWRDDVIRGAVLVALSFPTAMVFSVPLAFLVGISLTEKKGIHIKSSYSIERLSKCSTVVFDKSGTLTDVKLSVVPTNPAISEQQLLAIAGEVLKNSDSQEAVTIRRMTKDITSDITVEKTADVGNFGTIATFAGRSVAVGSVELMEKLGVTVTEKSDDEAVLLHISLDKAYLGYISITEKICNGVDNVLHGLKESGIKSIVMITEDKVKNATKIADALQGIDEFNHSLDSNGKVKVIEEIFADSAENETLTYVTGSTDDASVLASADISVTLNGMDSEDTDVIITDTSIDNLPFLIETACNVIKTSKINIAVSLAIKLLTAILGLFGVLGLGTVFFIDICITLLATLNSLKPIL